MQPENFVKFVKCASEHYIFFYSDILFLFIYFLLGKYAPPIHGGLYISLKHHTKYLQ